MTHYKRSDRVSGLIVSEISGLLMREIKDPRIGFVSITGAKVSDDLKHAKVFISVFGDDKVRLAALKGLESATGFIRRTLKKRLDLRYIPEIVFKLDDSIEQGIHISEILEGLEKEKAGLNDR